MSSIGSPSPFFLAGKKAYEVERSLRFHNSDDTRIQRAIGSTSNRRTFTYSFWIKRTVNSTEQYLFYNGPTSGTPYFDARFEQNSHELQIADYTPAGSPIRPIRFITNRKFRDPSAWYHVVVAVDTTQATQSNRFKLYVNGVQETSFSTATYPSQNYDSSVNVSGHIQGWGTSQEGTSGDYDGYLAEVNFIDGLQLTPSSFAETDAVTGEYKPKKYTGSYGTNGNYLNFSDNSGTTATTLGKDSSGNGNNFTPHNFAVSDSIPDTPTNNFCTLNALNKTNDVTLKEGNLEFFQSSNDESATGTFGITSGKWYWEVYKNNGENPELGIEPFTAVLAAKTNVHSNTKVCFRTNGGDQQVGTGTATSITGGSAQTGAGVIAIAVDFDNKKIWYSDLSGNFFNSGNPATGANAAFDFSSVEVANGCVPLVFCGTGSNNSCNFNFGQDGTFAGHTTAGGNADGNGKGNFKYSVPSGYLALCSANLPDPTILLPNEHFNTVLYTGNSSNGHAITGVGFQPNWTWIKARTDVRTHSLLDAVRGAGKIISSNNTNAEYTDATVFSSFDSDGFTVGTSENYINNSSHNYVAWNWNAGDTDGKTYTVTVVSDSGNKYRFDGYGTSAVTLDLAEGGTYIFDQSDSSNAGHPLRFSTTSNGTHGGGSEYTTGVTTSGTPGSSGAFTQIVVAASAPTLYYYCTQHSGMGGQANTNSTLGSSNFDGSIQSTAKVNATAGFSIVTWTGNGSSGSTIGHGLGVTPNFAIAKNRGSGSYNWPAVNFDLQTGGQLNTNQTFSNGNYNAYYGGQPSSSVLTLGSHGTTNANTNNYVAYVFSEVAGYSKFGSFVGNGNSDGTFIFLGFSAALIIYKNTSSAQDWLIVDPKRIHDGNYLDYLEPNTSDAEGAVALQITSNGFKLRESGTKFNGNGNTFIYLAFAESPFKNARAR